MAARRVAATTCRVSTDLPAPLRADLEAELPARVLADLQTGDRGLSSREAARRLIAAGPNELESRAARTWPRDLAVQFTHPLALLPFAAALLALAGGIAVLGWAILAVIVLNAALAFAQEQQAVRAVEALRAYLPPHATVIRDGLEQDIDARELVPGDVMLIREGGRVSADVRVLSGRVEIDLSALTGESVPVICTDKTGTLTQNRMHAVESWGDESELAVVMLACNDSTESHGDPTEVALREWAVAASPPRRRLATFAFDPRRRLTSTVDEFADVTWIDVKGAPDALLERCAVADRARVTAEADRAGIPETPPAPARRCRTRGCARPRCPSRASSPARSAPRSPHASSTGRARQSGGHRTGCCCGGSRSSSCSRPR